MKLINCIKNKKFAIIFLFLSLLLSVFVLDTPKAVSKTNLNSFSAIRAQEHIEVISREPHSYYDRDEHEEVRLYLVDTLTNYLGNENVFEFEYSVNEVKNKINEINGDSTTYEPDKVLYPVQNVLGVLPGTNPEGILLMAHYDSRGHVGRSGELGRSYGAMDDGYGVASILELAFILKDLNPVNSVYFLFTDAEEVGLYGALMAANDPQVMDNVRFVMNLEARGSYGPAYMFETSKNNHKVIELYKKAKYPVTYSMATAVYSVMPNFTDFTPMIDTGVPGLNFAVLAGLDYYHTPFDKYENIDNSSIQHMGSQVEPIIREFISNDKYIQDNYFDASSNQIFFTLFNGVLISYSELFAIIFVILLVLLFGLLTFINYKNKALEKEILTKTLPKSLLVFLGLIIIGVVHGMITAFLGKTPFEVTYTRVKGADIPTAILIIVLAGILMRLIQRKEGKVLYLGILINLLLALVTTFTLEGASFLFAFTALFGIVGSFADLIKNDLLKKTIYGVSYLVLLLIIVPLLYSFYMALTVGGTVVLTVLLGINGSVTLPLISKQLD